jgi:Ca-activated chloride channel family protein
MTGWKMVAARRATARVIDTLRDADRFSLLAFDHSVETPPTLPAERLAPATDRNRFRAVEFLAKIDARGGTEMAHPLVEAARMLSRQTGERDRILVLVTDGQVGNEREILANLSGLVAGSRVFTVGIDRAVNAGFLERLARVGGGHCELVESEDRLDDAMDRIHRRIGTPILSDLELSGAGMDIDEKSLVPARFPDLYPGTPLVIMGRYRGEGSGGVRVSAKHQEAGDYRITLDRALPGPQGLSAAWARGRIRDLEDEYDGGGTRTPRSELESEIIATSLEHQVLSRFTAFVAVDRSEVVNPDGTVREVVQPVDAPDGWGMFEPASADFGPTVLSAPVAQGGGFGDMMMESIIDPLEDIIEEASDWIQERTGIFGRPSRGADVEDEPGPEGESLAEKVRELMDWLDRHSTWSAETLHTLLRKLLSLIETLEEEADDSSIHLEALRGAVADLSPHVLDPSGDPPSLERTMEEIRSVLEELKESEAGRKGRPFWK